MIIELISAFALIFVAEMGDKTQLIAMSFATKYKLKQVIIGILIGSFFNHAIAVYFGYRLQQAIPLDILGLFAGIVFILFSLWNLKTEDAEGGSSNKYGPIITVAIAFFIGELGDKTQLTAFILSSESNYPLFTLLGTTLGMGVTGIIGILLGIKLGKKVPEIYIKVISSFVFLIFGTIKIYSNFVLIPYPILFVLVGTILYLIVFAYLYVPLYRSSKGEVLSVYLQQAESLKKIYQELSKKVDNICLDCNVCASDQCLIGLAKKVINDAKNGITDEYASKLPFDDKKYDEEKVLLAYQLVVKTLNEYPKDKSLLKLKRHFENILDDNS